MSDFETVLKNKLRQAEDALADDICRQLRSSRRDAIRPRPWWQRLPRIALPAAGLATASLIAVVVVTFPFNGGDHSRLRQESLSPENTAFYQDLEFYYWLAEHEKTKDS